MSQSQDSSWPLKDLQGSSDDIESRPILPPRPSQSSSTSIPTIESETLFSHNASSLQRKPAVPRRSSRLSLDKRSYTPISTSNHHSTDNGQSSPNKNEGHNGYKPIIKTPIPNTGHLPPKSFHKTHHFLGRDFGYWRQPARHGSIFAILFLWIFLPTWYSQYGFAEIMRQTPIPPFAYDCLMSSGWSFVGIDYRFGRLSFGQAKAIDLAWNWVVGRGYQGILTLLAYRVFSDALLRAAELTALPWELFASLALPGTKIELLWQISKNLFRYGNWRVKLIFFYVIIATIYLIAIPGLMDAATAYEANLVTYFEWPDGNSELAKPLGDFNDKAKISTNTRICLTFYTNTSIGDVSSYGGSKDYTFSYSYDLAPKNRFNYTWVKDPWDTPEIDIGNCQNTTQLQYRPQPLLWKVNVKGFYLRDWKDTSLNETWWKKFEEEPLLALDYNRWWEWGFYPANSTHFNCVAEKDVYQWGFSFEWLFLINLLNIIFLLGLWILWVDCDTNSALCRARRRLGLWRAVADIGEALREELGENVCAYSEEELLRAVSKRGTVRYYVWDERGLGRGEGDGGDGSEGREGDEGREGGGGKGSEVAHIGLSSKGSKTKGGRLKIEWGREYGRYNKMK